MGNSTGEGMYRICTALMIILLLIGCGQSEFEKSMGKGKDALRENKFQEAQQHFENALIEEPTNKDVLALIDRTKNDMLIEKRKQLINKEDDLYQKMNVITLKLNENADNLTVNDAKLGLAATEHILSDAKNLHILWNSDVVVGGLSKYIYDAAMSLNNVFQSVSENIQEPLPVTDSWTEQRRAVLNSNDSYVRARVNIQSYRTAIEGYESELIKIDLMK